MTQTFANSSPRYSGSLVGIPRNRSRIRLFAAADVAVPLSAAMLVGVVLCTSVWGLKISLETWSSAMFALLAITLSLRAMLHGGSFFGSPIYPAVFVYALYIGVGPLVKEAVGLPATTVSSRSLLVAWVGFVAMGAGYLFGKPRNPAKASMFLSPGGEALPQSWLRGGAIAYTFVGGTALLAYVARSGGLGFFLQSHFTTRFGGSAEGYAEWSPAAYSVPIELLMPGLLLLIAWTIMKPRSWYWVVAVFLYSAALLLWFGPVHGTRIRVFTIALSVGCLFRFRDSRRRVIMLRSGLYLLAGVAILGALVWGAFRQSFSLQEMAQADWSSLDAAQSTTLVTGISITALSDTFQGIVDAVPEAIPYAWGSTFYRTLTVFVPRALWPSKPHDLTIWVAENVEHVFGGVTSAATWPGELYLDFGVTGVVAGMALTGWLLARLARLGRSGKASTGVTAQALLYTTLYSLPVELMRGGSNALLWHLMSTTLPIWAIIWLARSNPKQIVRRGRTTAAGMRQRSSTLIATRNR